MQQPRPAYPAAAETLASRNFLRFGCSQNRPQADSRGSARLPAAVAVQLCSEHQLEVQLN
jgi:hypothetical protein